MIIPSGLMGLVGGGEGVVCKVCHLNGQIIG